MKASAAFLLLALFLSEFIMTEEPKPGKNSAHPPVLYFVHCLIFSQLSAHCLGDLKISFSKVATPTGTYERES